MKNTLCCILFFVCSTATTYAQIILIPKAGISYSNVSFSDDILQGIGRGSSYNLGSMFGVAVNIPVAGPFSIQPELQFAQKGYKFIDESYSSTSLYKLQNKFSFNYIELPVLGSLQFGDADVQVIINLGPYIGFGIGGKNKLTVEDAKNPDDTDSNYNEEYKIKFGTEPETPDVNTLYVDNAFDFGFQAGLGLGVSAGPGYIVLEQRFVYGLLNLNDKIEGTSDFDVKSQNRSFYVSLGYTIPLGSGGGEKEKQLKNKFKKKGFRF